MSGKHLISAQAGQLHGEIKTQDVTISGTYPTAVPPIKLKDRKDFVLHNATGVDIWLGGPDVTQHNGVKVAIDGVFSTQLGRAELYAVTASTTVSGVRVMELS